MGATRRLGVVLLTAGMVAGSLALTTGRAALGALPPCRVRNVSQETFGRSLIRMVERARDGDELRVRGTCGGTVVIDVDILLHGVGESPTLTGRGRTRVMRVLRGAVVGLQDLVVQRGSLPSGRYGAGILNRGRLRLVGVTIRRNEAPDFGGIDNRGRLRLRDVVVHSNTGGGIRNGGNLRIAGSTIRENTYPAGLGAGIINFGTLTITGSVIRDNVSTVLGENEGGAGGIANLGTLVITQSSIEGNSAAGFAGGIANGGGKSATITDSRVADNTAGRGAGGISNGGSLTLTRSSVAGNTADENGGGIYNGANLSSAEITLVDSTVAGNTAGSEGGGIWNFPGGLCGRNECPPSTVTLDASSSVTGNTPDDCVGTPAC